MLGVDGVDAVGVEGSMPGFTITEDLLKSLEHEKSDLQQQISQLTERLATINKKIEAIPLFLPVGTSASGEEPESDDVRTAGPAEAVLTSLYEAHRPMLPAEIREWLEAKEYPTERFGKNAGYFYTVLMRLTKSGLIDKVHGRYVINRDYELFRKEKEKESTRKR